MGNCFQSVEHCADGAVGVSSIACFDLAVNGSLYQAVFRRHPKKIVVAVSDVENKNYLFDSNERIEIVKKALFSDLKLDKKKISIISFTSLTTDLCKKYKSNIILRGLRAVSDFEYEFQLAGMNRKLNNNIETIFLMSDVENQIISSRFVKEIAKLDGNVSKFVTKSVIKYLKEKI